jgi:hypothetical protein
MGDMVTKKYIAYDICGIQWYIFYHIMGRGWAAACRLVNTDTVGHCIKDELKTDRPCKQKNRLPQGDSITAAGKTWEALNDKEEEGSGISEPHFEGGRRRSRIPEESSSRQYLLQPVPAKNNVKG